MEIQISKLRHWNCEPLHMWTSVFHQIVVFATKLSLSKLENHHDDEDKRKRQIKTRAAVRNTERVKQNTHRNCTPHFLADPFVIKAQLMLSDLIGMAIRDRRNAHREPVQPCVNDIRSWRKDGTLKILTRQRHIKSI